MTYNTSGIPWDVQQQGWAEAYLAEPRTSEVDAMLTYTSKHMEAALNNRAEGIVLGYLSMSGAMPSPWWAYKGIVENYERDMMDAHNNEYEPNTDYELIADQLAELSGEYYGIPEDGKVALKFCLLAWAKVEGFGY